MTELAVRFLALLGPISAYGVFVRIVDGRPPSTWVPLLIFSIVINAITIYVVWRNRHNQIDLDENLAHFEDDEEKDIVIRPGTGEVLPKRPWWQRGRS